MSTTTALQKMGDDEIKNDVDLFRNTPVRYLGYANEVGESFRSIIGNKWANFTYVIASGYVLADTVHKTNETFHRHRECDMCAKQTIYVATDTLLWQMMASVILPGFTINRLCATMNFMLKKTKLPSKKWIVSGFGLAAIPLIINPIDNLVDKVMDRTFRKFNPQN